MAVSVGHFNVGAVFHEIFDNFVVSVEAGGSQRCRVGAGCAVNVGAVLYEQFDDAKVSGGSGAPEGRGALYCFAVDRDCGEYYYFRD